MNIVGSNASDWGRGYGLITFWDEAGNQYLFNEQGDQAWDKFGTPSFKVPQVATENPNAYEDILIGGLFDRNTGQRTSPYTYQDAYDQTAVKSAIDEYLKNNSIPQQYSSLSGGDWANDLHSGAVSGVGSAISAVQPIVSSAVENTLQNGPTLVGAAFGGPAGAAAGSLLTDTGRALGTNYEFDPLQSGVKAGAAALATYGAQGLLGGSTPDYGIDGYLSPEEYFADVNQFVPTSSDLPIGMNLSGEPTGYSAPQQLQTINPDYVAASNAGQTIMPVIYGSQGMLDAGQQLGLTPEQTLSLSDTSLGGVSANELAGNTAAANNTSDITNKAASKAVQQFSKGLLSQGANMKMPTFDINFTPLSAQTWGATGNNWLGDATQQAVEAAATAPQIGAFKGSFLMGRDRDKDLTKYLAEYLPLNASKKLKGLSSYLA